MSALNLVVPNETPATTIHDEAMSIAKDFKAHYLKLFEVLLVVESRQLYYEFDVPSFYTYCTELLELSKDVTKDFITVVRKSLEVPELAEAIRSRRVTIPKVRKVCSVLNHDNCRDWVALAEHCSSRVVEKAVAMANPKEAVKESLQYVSGDLLEFKIGASEEWTKLLERTKDLMSQKTRKTVTSADALFIAMSEYCSRHDPVEKAKRIQARQRKGNRSTTNKSPTDDPSKNPVTLKARRSRKRPSRVEHLVNLRDKNQCVHVDSAGNRCEERRWLNKHHIVEFANGGDHSPENLQTLCWGHHKIRHLKAEGVT